MVITFSTTMMPLCVMVLFSALTIIPHDAVPTITQKNVTKVTDINPIHFPGSPITNSSRTAVPQGNTVRVASQSNMSRVNSSDVTNDNLNRNNSFTNRNESVGKVEEVVSNVNNLPYFNSTNGNLTNYSNASVSNANEEVDVNPYYIIDAPVRPDDEDHGCAEGQRWSFGHCREILD